MKESFILDACALIAFLSDEDGADVVENIFQRAESNEIVIYMNKINLLEIYYGVYREDGKEKAEKILSQILDLPLIVIDNLTDEVFKEAGRIKAFILPASIFLAEGIIGKHTLTTTDHHEFDIIEDSEGLKINWVR